MTKYKEPKDLFTNLPEIVTERLILRKIKIEDAQDLFEYASDEEMTKYVTWSKPKSLDDSKKFINFQLSQYKKGEPAQWGLEDKLTHKFIGTCGFHNWSPKNNHAEIVYAIARSHWGKGYMSEAIKTVIQFGFENMNLNRIEATVMTDNIGSQKVLLKNGMKEEGHIREWIKKNGIYYDLKIFGIVRKDYDKL